MSSSLKGTEECLPSPITASSVVEPLSLLTQYWLCSPCYDNQAHSICQGSPKHAGFSQNPCHCSPCSCLLAISRQLAIHWFYKSNGNIAFLKATNQWKSSIPIVAVYVIQVQKLKSGLYQSYRLQDRYSTPPVFCRGNPLVSNAIRTLRLHPQNLIALGTHKFPIQTLEACYI